MTVDIGMHGLTLNEPLFHLYQFFIWKNVLRWACFPVMRLLKEHLVVLDFLSFEPIFNSFPSLNQVSRWGACMTNESIIIHRGLILMNNFLLCKSRLDLWGSLTPPLSVFAKAPTRLLGHSLQLLTIGKLNLYFLMNTGARSVHFLIFEISSFVNYVRAAPVKLFRKVWTRSLSLSPY